MSTNASGWWTAFGDKNTGGATESSSGSSFMVVGMATLVRVSVSGTVSQK